MSSRVIKFYVILCSIVGFVSIHLLLFNIGPSWITTCPGPCYLSGWPFGSYEHNSMLIPADSVTSVFAIGWLLNSLLGALAGALIGLIIGSYLIRSGRAVSFPIAVPEKECLNRCRAPSDR